MSERPVKKKAGKHVGEGKSKSKSRKIVVIRFSKSEKWRKVSKNAFAERKKSKMSKKPIRVVRKVKAAKRIKLKRKPGISRSGFPFNKPSTKRYYQVFRYRFDKKKGESETLITYETKLGKALREYQKAKKDYTNVDLTQYNLVRKRGRDIERSKLVKRFLFGKEAKFK
jgi:hypothetical protein